MECKVSSELDKSFFFFRWVLMILAYKYNNASLRLQYFSLNDFWYYDNWEFDCNISEKLGNKLVTWKRDISILIKIMKLAHTA